MMPSTLVRWPLLFISGIFIPLGEMAPWTRALAYLSPLTVVLLVFLVLAARMHRRSRALGY